MAERSNDDVARACREMDWSRRSNPRKNAEAAPISRVRRRDHEFLREIAGDASRGKYGNKGREPKNGFRGWDPGPRRCECGEQTRERRFGGSRGVFEQEGAMGSGGIVLEEREIGEFRRVVTAVERRRSIARGFGSDSHAPGGDEPNLRIAGNAAQSFEDGGVVFAELVPRRGTTYVGLGLALSDCFAQRQTKTVKMQRPESEQISSQ